MTAADEQAEPADALATERRRAAILAAMSELADATRELKTLFDRLEVALRRAAPTVEAGTTALDLVTAMDLPGRREALNEVAARARNAQSELLRALFLAAEAEGATKADIARTWRVSRQLVSRMTREPA